MRKFKLNVEKAIRHITFCCELYQLQLDAGRYFLHEHPWSAKSWNVNEMRLLQNDPRVEKVMTHMCRFEMRSHIDKKDGPTGLVKKPTGFPSNSWCIREALALQCTGGHSHVPLMGGTGISSTSVPARVVRRNMQRTTTTKGI